MNDFLQITARRECLPRVPGVGLLLRAGMIQQWIDYRLEMEYYAVRNHPHPYEETLYFDV